MTCLVCQKPLDGYTPLCELHAPAWGKSLRINNMAIFPGELGIFEAIIARLMGQKLIRWWLGTDVWLLWAFPPGRGKLSVLKHRLKYHLTKFLVSENWITSERLANEFIACGGRRAWVRYHIAGMLTEKIQKREHININIGYYDPENDTSARWKYGVDLIEKLKLLFLEVKWIRLDGSLDMRTIYATLDGYIRPSRHDGRPRIVIECQLNFIPYYWSEDGQPNLDEMSEFVEKVICAEL